MISLCTVLLEPLEEYLEKYFVQNLKRTKLVDELLIAKVDTNEDFKVEKDFGKVKYVKFGCPTNVGIGGVNGGIQHATGMHACIDKAKNDLVFITDPDILFYNNIDEIYIELMETYKLNIIGCSHQSSIEYACGYYPNQTNMIFRKSDLPDTSFLDEHLIRRNYKIENTTPIEHGAFPGKWLMPGAIPKYADLFPNKNGFFETSCNLYLLGHMQNWRWLSFQTPDCINYSTQYRRCNFKPLPAIKKHKLLYHLNNSWYITNELKNIALHNAVPSGMMPVERYDAFLKEFEKIENEEE